MAVTRLKRIRQTRITEDKVTGIVEVNEPWIMHLDNPREPRLQLMLEKPEFAPFQPHSDEPTARCISAEISQRKHSLIYDLSIRWSNDITVPTSPYDEPAKITVETVERTVPFTHDYEGNPNVNKAGDFFEDAEDEDMMLVFRINKKIPPNYPDWLLDYGGVMNSDSVTIKGQAYKAKELKVAKVQIGEESDQDDIPFVTLQMEIIRNAETWEKTFLNRGVRELAILRQPAGNGDYKYVIAKVPILDKTQKPISSPEFLDEDGRRPRVDGSGRRVSLEDELRRLRNSANQPASLSEIKHPLDPDDIIVLNRTRKKPRPFNGVLPLA